MYLLHNLQLSFFKKILRNCISSNGITLIYLKLWILVQLMQVNFVHLFTYARIIATLNGLRGKKFFHKESLKSVLQISFSEKNFAASLLHERQCCPTNLRDAWVHRFKCGLLCRQYRTFIFQTAILRVSLMSRSKCCWGKAVQFTGQTILKELSIFQK